MAISRKEEERALDQGERELVAKSSHPQVQELTDAELAALIKLVRERRDRAQSLAAQRRREIRGKGVPRGAVPVTGDAGSKTKVQVLAMAMRRLNAEAERRERMAAHVSLMDNARRALELKQAGAAAGGGTGAPGPENSRTAFAASRTRTRATSAEIMRPMERGRQRKAGAVAQAKRDSR